MSNLPRNWKVVKLHTIATVQTGLAVNADTDRNDPVTLPYLRVANVQDGHLDLTEIKTISISRSHVDRYALQAGDVLMTEGGDFDKLGRGAVWNGQITPCLHQNHVFAVRPDNSVILSPFLAAYCESEAGKRYFLSCSKQTTNLASINSTQLKDLPVVVPPVPDQSRILKVLRNWNQAIDYTERLFAAKQVRYRALLHKLVAPAFFADQRPSNWTKTKLGEVFCERDERAADLPLLAITGSGGVVPRDELDRRQTASEDKSKYKVIRPSDIGYNTMRMWQGVFGRSEHAGIVSPAYTVVTAKRNALDPHFASHLFAHPKAISLFFRYSQGLVDDTLMLKFPQFAEITIWIPGLSEQIRIGQILDAEDATLSPIRLYLKSLREQRRGLMQKLLPGKWLLDGRFDVLPALSPKTGKASLAMDDREGQRSMLT